MASMLFGGFRAWDQSVRSSLTRIQPRGMEIWHLSVLKSLSWHGGERSPAQLAQTFNVTRGAMTNTLSKLEWAGYVHIRPDWGDARRKMVAISPAGRQARDAAVNAITPMITNVVDDLGEEQVRATRPIRRALRRQLSQE